jgi:FtsH-binding integral membrane protein
MASLCFRTSVLFALVAAGLALWMTANHDYRALQAEVALFVLGWVSFMAYGLYYRTIAAAAAGIAKIHYIVALIGVTVEAVGIIGTEWGNPFFDPFRIIGALIVAIGFVLFAIIVFATRETAARS